MQWILGKSRPSNVLTIDGRPFRAGLSGDGDWVQALLKQAGLSDDEKRQAYASELLVPYLEPILSQALVSMPQDPHLFVLDWLVSHLEVRIPGEISKAFYGWMAKDSDSKLAEPPGSLPDDPQDFAGVMGSFVSDDSREDALGESTPDEPVKSASHRLRRNLAKAHTDLTKSRSRRSSDGGAVNAVGGVARRDKKRVTLTIDHSQDNDASTSPTQKRGSLVGALEAEAWRRRMRRMSATDDRNGSQLEISAAEIQNTIASIPLFSKCTTEELKALSEACTLRCCEDGETLLALGQQESELFVIHKGSCRISVLQEDSMLHSGSCFGEEILFGTNRSSQRQISACQDEPVVTACFSRESLQRLKLFSRLKSQRLRNMSSEAPSVEETTSACFDEDEGLLEEEDDLMREESFQAKSTPRASLQSRQVNLGSTFGGAGVLGAVGTGITELDADMQRAGSDNDLILDAIRTNPQLRDVLQLDERHVLLVAELVTLCEMAPGTIICDIGHVLQHLYIVQEGVFDLFGPLGRPIGKVRAGECFGDLCLLYGAKSPHGVIARRKARAWRLDRDGLLKIQNAKLASQREGHARLLQAMPLFEGLKEDQLSSLVDALEELRLLKGEALLRSGSRVQCLYFVAHGQLQSEDQTIVVKQGDNFGLDDFLSNSICQSTLKVASDAANVLMLDISSIVSELQAMGVSHDASLNDLAAKLSECAGVLNRRSPTSKDRFASTREKVLAEHGEGDATPSSASSSQHVDKGRLKSLGVLGQGSFGVVTLEEDSQTGKWYALKALSKDRCAKTGQTEHVLREKNTHMLLDSPFIIKLYTTYKDHNYLYFLMDVAAGGELFTKYQEHEDWFGNAELARFFMAGCALGLEHMHSQKVIYRDLKLENVLLDSRGYPLLSDFGLAKQVVGKTYTVAGTPDYMAPEVLRRSGHNRAVDWWALGVVLHVMMSGQSPFDDAEPALIYRNIVRGLKKEHFPDSFNEDLTDVIKGLCRKKPEERLPMGPKGLAHLRQAPWLSSLDWAALEQQTLKAPWRPAKLSAAELVTGPCENIPAVVPYEDDGSGWDAAF
eukprot:TRINITY_DN7525_c1_g2_i1.p1 TRINITY_DN7525_c1_g2~~TRINITY_DN7525_c1_g2_i1.p1  ORF type:complete len:1066 (+),score=217.97 TRINITY_DN7525_c1_g2_i1:52-3249(+)